VNNEVLTVIRSGATSEGGFGSPGRLQEVDINHIDYVTCSDLYDGDIIDSVMLYAGVPGGGADRDWIDATICMLSRSHPTSCGSRLTGTLVL
jgi:hypothetical protein